MNPKPTELTSNRHPRTASLLRIILAVTIIKTICHFPSQCQGQMYDDISRVFDDRLGSKSNYKTTIRPQVNHSRPMNVTVTFDILSIVEVAATTQKFVINAFVAFYWTDELLAWNYTEYNKVLVIHPYPDQIWRPRVILINTRQNRDLFEDDYSPLSAWVDGSVAWFPGSLFPTSCKLDLYKYPFDEQRCTVDMFAMGLTSNEMTFIPGSEEVGKSFYVESGEWSITSTTLDAGGSGFDLPYIKVAFNLKRLPGFFIVNIVAPIVLMSFLNILVFLIPVDSGEKIGYGITVLLALTVFMSIVSEQLPRSSDTLPIVTVYLLVLTIISVCTVIVSIIIVFFHHKDEEEVKHQKASSDFKSAFHKVSIANRALKNFANPKIQHVAPASTDNQFSSSTKSLNAGNAEQPPENRKIRSETLFTVLDDMKDKGENNNNDLHFEPSHKVNKWRQIGQHLDMISFLVFTVIWISVTVGFLVEMAR